MSPRAYAGSTGLPGPGQDRFPEQVKDAGRDMGLIGSVTIIHDVGGDDGAGSPKSQWTDKETVRGRIDTITSSTRGMRAEFGDKLTEESTHIVSVDAGVDINPSQRLRVDGKTWIVTTKMEQTDRLIERVAVRGL